MLNNFYNYTTNFKNNQYYKKLLNISLFLFILSLFFPIRHVFLTREAYLTGQYSDFTSFSLYLSDILLFTTCFWLILPRGKNIWIKIKQKTLDFLLLQSPISNFQLLIFWLILGLFLHFSHITLFWTLKWLELIVAYETVRLVISEQRIGNRIGQSFAWLFVGFSTIQAIIALLQFCFQRSLGLYKLGESHLSSNGYDVAKFAVNGANYIRGYGTFPHPNLLAVFLLVSILFASFLFITTNKKWQIVWGFCIFINILGLTITFSRTGYLALVLGLIMFFFPFIISRIKHRTNAFFKAIMLIAIIIVSGLFSFLLFRNFLLTRATINDNAVSERVEYNNIGFQMIKANPIFGLGTGGSVLHMQQYSDKSLESWQKQPIHNYFLISAAELGLPGALILIWIFISHLKKLVLNIKYKLLGKESSLTYYLLLTTIFLCFLLLMLFDHYFYTLQQTQMLLWVMLGIINAETKNPKRGAEFV